MVAAVETMMYAESQGVPWHGLGTKIGEVDRYDIEKCIVHSGLGWGVELEPLFLEDGTSVAEFSQAVRRTTDKRVLGTVGPRYNPLQNKDAFAWFQPLLDQKLCMLDTAGSLEEGAKVWILAQLSGDLEIAKDDIIRKYLLLSNSHDGSMSVRIGLTPIRVVCANTLAMAHNNAGSKLLRLRHHKNLAESMEKVRDIIDLANQEFKATAEQYRFLASRRVVHAGDLRKYVQVMAGISEEQTDEISTKSKNIMDRIMSLISSGIGNDAPSVKGTWWAAYNGMTQYLTWERGRTTSTRLDSLWFGQGYSDNGKALKLATEYANAA